MLNQAANKNNTAAANSEVMHDALGTFHMEPPSRLLPYILVFTHVCPLLPRLAGRLTVPAQVTELRDEAVSAIAAGALHSAAVTVDGRLYEWGLLFEQHEHRLPGEVDAEHQALVGLAGGGDYRRLAQNDYLRRIVLNSEAAYITDKPISEFRVSRAAVAAGAARPTAAALPVDDASAAATPHGEPAAGGAASGAASGASGRRTGVDVLRVRVMRVRVDCPRLAASLAGIKIVGVAAGYGHTAAWDSGGRVYACGYNDRGQLGLGHRIATAGYEPITAESITGKAVVKVACGQQHNVAVAADGSVFAWGSGALGQLGLGGSGDRLAPELVAPLGDLRIVDVAAGSNHSVFVTDSGMCLACGHSEYGQMGASKSGAGDLMHTSRYYYVPRPIEGLQRFRVIRVAAGAQFTVAVLADGTAVSFGWDAYFCLGHGGDRSASDFSRVAGLQGRHVLAVGCGYNHALAVVAPDGHPYAAAWAGLLRAANPHAEYDAPHAIGREPRKPKLPAWPDADADETGPRYRSAAAHRHAPRRHGSGGAASGSTHVDAGGAAGGDADASLAAEADAAYSGEVDADGAESSEGDVAQACVEAAPPDVIVVGSAPVGAASSAAGGAGAPGGNPSGLQPRIRDDPQPPVRRFHGLVAPGRDPLAPSMHAVRAEITAAVARMARSRLRRVPQEQLRHYNTAIVGDIGFQPSEDAGQPAPTAAESAQAQEGAGAAAAAAPAAQPPARAAGAAEEAGGPASELKPEPAVFAHAAVLAHRCGAIGAALAAAASAPGSAPVPVVMAQQLARGASMTIEFLGDAGISALEPTANGMGKSGAPRTSRGPCWRINAPNIRRVVLRALLAFLYSDALPHVPSHRVPALRALADALQLPRLSSWCDRLMHAYDREAAGEVAPAWHGQPPRQPRLAGNFAEDGTLEPPTNWTTPPDSVFVRDMRAAWRHGAWADVVLHVTGPALPSSVLTTDGPAAADSAAPAGGAGATAATRGAVFKLHKLVLCRYEFFRKLLHGQFSEAAAVTSVAGGAALPSVALADLDPDDFAAVVDYIYTGDVSALAADAETCMRVVAMASRLCVPDLVTSGQDIIAERMATEDARAAFEFAESFGLTRLQKYAKALMNVPPTAEGPAAVVAAAEVP